EHGLRRRARGTPGRVARQEATARARSAQSHAADRRDGERGFDGGAGGTAPRGGSVGWAVVAAAVRKRVRRARLGAAGGGGAGIAGGGGASRNRGRRRSRRFTTPSRTSICASRPCGCAAGRPRPCTTAMTGCG